MEILSFPLSFLPGVGSPTHFKLGPKTIVIHGGEDNPYNEGYNCGHLHGAPFHPISPHLYPRFSMYGIFTYVWPILMVNHTLSVFGSIFCWVNCVFLVGVKPTYPVGTSTLPPHQGFSWGTTDQSATQRTLSCLEEPSQCETRGG